MLLNICRNSIGFIKKSALSHLCHTQTRGQGATSTATGYILWSTRPSCRYFYAKISLPAKKIINIFHLTKIILYIISYKSVRQFWKIKKIDRVFFLSDPIWPQGYKLYYIASKVTATVSGMHLCDLYLLELNSCTRF